MEGVSKELTLSSTVNIHLIEKQLNSDLMQIYSEDDFFFRLFSRILSEHVLMDKPHNTHAQLRCSGQTKITHMHS